MDKLDTHELKTINGGFSLWIAIGVGLAFISSVLYGFFNPSKCS